MLVRIVILFIVTTLGCRDTQKAPTTSARLPGSSAPAPQTPTPAPSSTSPAGAALDEAPSIDLLANRYRWHLYTPGLVVPIASEGLRKYTQEYSQPWGEVVEVAGKRGRTLERKSATLRFPSDDAGERVVTIRMHGLVAGQRVTVKLNGKSANVSPAAEWQALSVKLPVRAGENELQIAVAKRGSSPASYGVFHSLEVGSAPTEAWPPLTPIADVTIGGAARPALAGVSRMAIYLEVPQTAHLVVDTGADAAAPLTITARAVDGSSTTLLDAQQAAGAWTPRQLSLAALAGKVVRLELVGDVAWSNARIALADAPTRPRPPAYANAILVVVDALRSDRLAVYGKTRVRTPRITAAAKTGVVFLHNQAASPSSPPSHGSIQTGMIPRVHGVTGDTGQLVPGTPMISTQAVDAGISAGYWGNNAFGMARLKKPGRWTEFHQPAQEGLGIDCTALIPELLEFASAQAKASKRFFISSLPYEPHVPYRYHPEITDRYYAGPWDTKVGKSVSGDQLGAISGGKLKLSDKQWQQLKALYDGEVEYFDGCFGTLLDGLAEHGLADSTAIIITSDHGEGMFEHGKMGHAFGHYAELGNVPLIVIAPNLVTSGRTIEVVTSQLDIAPTILDLMGVEPSPRIQGQSLLPVMLRDGPWVPRVMPLEYGRSYALRAREWKYIVDYSGTESVFDLARDPTEQNNVVDDNAFALRYLRDIAGFFLAHRSAWRMETWGTFDNHAAGFIEAVER